jgi:hypothetical protein
VIALDNIRICWRWPFRLARAALATLLSLWLRHRTRCTLRVLDVLLLLASKASYAPALLSRELSSGRLTSNGAVASLSLPSRLLVGDDIIRGATLAAFAVRYLLVLLVCVRVLEDDVPCVKETGKYAKAAESEVDERVGAADALLYPYYTLC